MTEPEPVTIVLIVPAGSEFAGQCRIVAQEFDAGCDPSDPLRSYRKDPGAWREIGLMGSRGQLVCCDAPIAPIIVVDQPLRAGMWWRVPA